MPVKIFYLRFERQNSNPIYFTMCYYLKKSVSYQKKNFFVCQIILESSETDLIMPLSAASWILAFSWNLLLLRFAEPFLDLSHGGNYYFIVQQ